MWRMAIVGLPEFLAYCLANPGRSRFELSCQGSELMIGMIKLFCKECGNGKDNMPDLVADFCDLSGPCMIHNNQVRFDLLLQKLLHDRLLIFDEKETPLIELMLENQMPPLMKHIVDILTAWKPGTPIDEFLNQILHALTLNINALNVSKLQKILANTNVRQSYSHEIDIHNSEYDETLQQMRDLNENFLNRISSKSSLRVQRVIANDVL